MNKTVIFFGSEKPVLNLIRYDFYNKLIKQELITMTTYEIYSKYPQLPNTITYNSNWRTKDVYSFTLHLLLFNFVKNINKGLFYDLRAFLFGPYKIKSPKFLFMAMKFLIKACRSIKFTSIVKNQKNSSDVIENLRKKGAVGLGDHNNFVKILKEVNASKVVTISNFRDPKLFDLASACKELSLDLHVFVECWDNLSTGYGVPTGVSHIYTWSSDQIHDFYKFNVGHNAEVQICGSYRRSYSEIHRISRLRDASTTKDTDLRILYLEGYFYEDLNFSIGKIIEAIKLVHSRIGNTRKIKIVIRKYPLKRQSVDSSLHNSHESKNEGDYNEFIEIETSQNKNLDEDFEQADMVLSELTTAGLESAFRGIPVVFLGSNSSIRFLDSMAGYNYSFSQAIKYHFELLNLSSKGDVKRLQVIFELLLSTKSNSMESNFKLLLTTSEQDKFSIPFDFDSWNRLTEV
jgi:hypothetical protein